MLFLFLYFERSVACMPIVHRFALLIVLECSNIVFNTVAVHSISHAITDWLMYNSKDSSKISEPKVHVLPAVI